MSKYPIHLTDEQREHLHKLIRGGKAPARKLTHARILLKADAQEADPQTAQALEVSVPTIWRVRKRFCEEGFESALEHKHPRQLKPPRLDGRGQARLFALACSDPPAGRARWTLQLLADRLVELDVVPHICLETVRKTLKKGTLHLI